MFLPVPGCASGGGEETIANHIKGARKIPIFCYDFNTNEYLMEFEGIRIAARALSIEFGIIRYRLDKNKPLKVQISEAQFNMLFKTKKD